MEFAAREIKLKDGRTCTLRPTRPEDAAAMIEYMKVTAGETEFILRYPDEIHYTEEGEREILERFVKDPEQVMMVGIVDGKIAGNCALSGMGDKRKLRHRSSLAITLYKEYWNLGIGRAMIGYLSELAEQMGFEQIDLEVVADNTRAQALYEKCGFVASGRRTRALKFDDGTYHDEILMTKILHG
ncbi:MAG: GNAT family N-acetyltransferase, partial [Lachnospiraceae bacterium]|nr:GNAT family N-acetyltransferase [Lachnospiraceae bacterium]